MYLSRFRSIDPPYERSQDEGVRWLAQAYRQYASGAKTKAEYENLIRRVGCSPEQIASRRFFLPDFKSETIGDSDALVFKSDHVEGASIRQRFYQTVSDEIFSEFYEPEIPSARQWPSHLIHVSCTGYGSPSGAQKVVARAGARTTVTHAYHMGCYGAFPALRMASGFLSSPLLRSTHETATHLRNAVDIVHTELCGLHMNPIDPSLEQMVIQSLFADGAIGYSATSEVPKGERSLKVLALGEFVLPASEDAMTWSIGDHGMEMTLSKDVPRRIAQALRETLLEWEAECGIPVLRDIGKSYVAVHPGGPKIIDGVRALLELRDDQLAASRQILRERGNMSSATVPHIWKELLKGESDLPSDARILSMAFGPGLTLSLALMQVCES